jgi:hypothetical protein
VAGADTSVVVALAAAAALVTVVVRHVLADLRVNTSVRGDGSIIVSISSGSVSITVGVKLNTETVNITNSDSLVVRLQVKTSKLRGAAIIAAVGADGQQILGALNVLAREGDIETDGRGDGVTSSNEILHEESSSNLNVIDDAVGETLEGLLNIKYEITEIIGRGETLDDDGASGEGLVQLRLKGEGKSLSIKRSKGSTVGGATSGLEEDRLDLMLALLVHVVALIHDVSAVGAHALGAIIVTILRVADATASLVAIPAKVVEGVGILTEERPVTSVGSSIHGSGLEGHVLNVSAATVAGAVIGAGSALAALALIAGEALALTRVAVANTTARALSISVAGHTLVTKSLLIITSGGTKVTNLVGIVINGSKLIIVVHALSEGRLKVRGVNEGNLVGADALGAIATVLAETKAPVVVALADAALAADTVARAGVIAASLSDGNESRQDEDSVDHLSLED